MDALNASFECVGGILIWMSVYALHKSKGYAGIHILQITFYMLWGLWNVIYYPSIEQWWSFVAGVHVLIANIAWLVLALIYGRLDSTIVRTGVKND